MRRFLPASIGLISFLLPFFLGSIFLFAKELVWKTEGRIFSDPSIHNVEVLYIPGISPNYNYRMYFNQEGKIKSAVSSDGQTFTVENGNRLEEGTAPSIIKLEDGRYRIYYHVADSTGKTIIKSAVSKQTLDADADMREFTIEPGIRLSYGGEFDPDGVLHPSVIALPRGGYRMYYNGEIKKTEQEFTWRILSAASTDGLTWVKEPGVRVNMEVGPVEADLIGSPHARYLPLTGTYEIYFSVQTPSDNYTDGIYLATSKDGLLFSEPVAQLTSEAEEIRRFGPGGQTGSYQDPFVLETATEKRMYYWVQGDGIYSARLTTQEPEPETLPFSRAVKQKLAELWERIKEFRLPENLELYIIPTILLIGGAAAVISLWRSRLRR